MHLLLFRQFLIYSRLYSRHRLAHTHLALFDLIFKAVFRTSPFGLITARRILHPVLFSRKRFTKLAALLSDNQHRAKRAPVDMSLIIIPLTQPGQIALFTVSIVFGILSTTAVALRFVAARVARRYLDASDYSILGAWSLTLGLMVVCVLRKSMRRMLR